MRYLIPISIMHRYHTDYHTNAICFVHPFEAIHTATMHRLHIDRPPRPYNLAILVYQRGKRNHEHANEAQQTVPPPKAKRLVHAVSSKRQHGAEETPDTRHTRDGARGVLREGVDEVGLDGYEDAPVEEPLVWATSREGNLKEQRGSRLTSFLVRRVIGR
jgi:hypothetical protein